MFFFGVFGFDSKIKEIGRANNIICPFCHSLTSMTVFKVYNYFHIFFIPTFRWNVKYIVKPICCKAVYSLNPDKGKAFEKGEHPDITPEDLSLIENGRVFQRCKNCGSEISQGYYYCPHCGQKL